MPDAGASVEAGAGVLIDDVTGRFLDSSGQPPPAGFEASVCGPVCYISQTEADGSFTVPIGDVIDVTEYSALPHGRPLIAGFYFALPAGATGPHIALGELPLVTMPTDGPSIDLAGNAEQQLTSGPVTLTIPAGVQTLLEFDDVVAGDSGMKFRAVSVDKARMGAYAPADADAVFALGPFESHEQQGGADTLTRLSFDNTASLPASSRVEFLALGTYLHPSWIAPARFVKVATGAVSADGKSVDLDPGQGFAYVTWVAIRAAGASP